MPQTLCNVSGLADVSDKLQAKKMAQTFRTEIEVRFSDFDLYGHVNSVVYFNYCETARVKVLKDVLKELADSNVHIVVAHAECDYRMPILFGEKLMVHSHVSKMGKSSFDLEYRLNDGVQKTYAVARTTMVCFNSVRKMSVPVPEIVRNILDWAE